MEKSHIDGSDHLDFTDLPNLKAKTDVRRCLVCLFHSHMGKLRPEEARDLLRSM